MLSNSTALSTCTLEAATQTMSYEHSNIESAAAAKPKIGKSLHH